ncbi:MAG TPA: hypothetical protein VMU84_15030 [Thermoanaerobaculia bacterium]|nr:hypothetical protein [Thermoanaerobaculia bacterium]
MVAPRFRIASVLVYALFLPTLAAAATFTLFGPRDFVRSTGAPQTERVTFAARNLTRTYKLLLENGGATGQLARVTSATVALNGQALFGPSDFNANTPAAVERDVTLAASNELAVEVRGNPGSGFTIRILGEDNDAPVITASVNPAPNAAGWNNTPVTVTFTCSDATTSVVNCPAPQILDGVTFSSAPVIEYAITRSVIDLGGNTGNVSVTVKVDLQPPSIEITAPTTSRTNLASVVIAGIVADATQASLTVAGQPLALTQDHFSTPIALEPGANVIALAATDLAGNTTQTSVSVERFVVPVVRITEPADLAVLRSAATNVRGTISDPAATVVVNGVPAIVSGTTFTAANIPLAQGRTVVTARATNALQNADAASILVYRDSIPPRVTLRYPPDGATVFESSLDVAGMVDDIVVGTINGGQARVSVNGVEAEVANRAFLARGVTLASGVNTLTITATDAGGNVDTVTSRVTFDAVTGKKIIGARGDGQRAAIGTTLAQPIVARLVNATGQPVANQTVSFEITENNGTLASGSASGRAVVATTNAQGEASVTWTLGTRAGAGNHRVVARADGFAGAVEFEAVGTIGTPALIVVDAGNNQFGATGLALPRPLIAVVVDRGSNRVRDAAVTFSITKGNGNFDGATSVVVHTDSDGRAIATPILGQTEANAFQASVQGVESIAAFSAIARVPGPVSATSIGGVILDNTDTPIAGVSVRIDGTSFVVQSDEQGQFTIPGAPVGYVKLLIDGSTARRAGTWPTLEFAMYTTAGVKNTLEMPIYLLPIDTRRGLFVDETNGGTLTLPELPGFSLTIAPGSATFPGGGRTGTVSVTAVHVDKVPMAPGFGQQPRFIVTIQPPGVHFDPPAAIAFPNSDGLAPGEVTELYSFDHDLGQFVAIGTGSIASDGLTIRSDPGVGIIKGGWHCGGNPNATGTTHDCPECKTCLFGTCVPNPFDTGSVCEHPPSNGFSIAYVYNNQEVVVVFIIDPSCLKKCTFGGDCKVPSDRWGHDNLAHAAQQGAERVLFSTCLGPHHHDAAQGGMAHKTFFIRCVDRPSPNPGGGPACASSPDAGVGNTITITNLPTAQCPNLPKTLGHEIMHQATGLVHHSGAIDCATDVIYPCDVSCWGQANACGTSSRPCI